MYTSHGITAETFLVDIIKYVTVAALTTPLSAVLTLILDKRKIKPMLKGILLYPLFLGSWILINIKAIIKPNTTWEKIEHVRSIDVEELS